MPAARRPTSRWAAGPPGPSSSISPRTATRRPGRSARTSSAAAIESGPALYVSSMTSQGPARSSVLRCGRAPRRGEARRDVARGEAGGQADGRGGEGVVDVVAPQRRHLDRLVHARGDEPEGHPGDAARDDVTGGHVGPRREAVGHHGRRRPRPHGGHERVVGVEDGRAAGRQGLHQPPLLAFDGGQRAGPHQVHAPHGRDDPDGRPRRGRPGGRCRPPRTCPSRGPPPGSRGPGAAGSAAGRPRCSGCPRWPAPRASCAARRRSASLVEVLATEPVTPTTSGWKRARHAAATRPSAATPSSTSTTVVSPSRSSGEASGASLTSRAVAPAATAASRNRWPSVRAPGRATKRLPGSTRRESTAAPRIGRPPERSRRPPLAAARPGASKAGRAGLGGGSRVASVTVGRHSPTRPLTVASRAAARRGPRACPAAASARSARPCWSRPRPGAADPGPRWCPAPRGGTAGTT